MLFLKLLNYSLKLFDSILSLVKPRSGILPFRENIFSQIEAFGTLMKTF